jgi:starvation-inducible DNA-binding protein
MNFFTNPSIFVKKNNFLTYQSYMKANIGIPEKNIEKCAAILSVILADEMTLYIKTRKFHWNVAGNSFMELHKLFEDHYTLLENTIDETAERINKLGAKTIGTMKEFSDLTSIKESPGVYPVQKDMLSELLNDHESVIQSLRKNIDTCDSEIKDVGTADFLTGVMEQHETIAWILRRYLS